jgi:hypothetical protein
MHWSMAAILPRTSMSPPRCRWARRTPACWCPPLVYGDSEAWVYVQTTPGTFLRTRIDTGNATGESYFVAASGGIHPGQPVVVNGAGLLLARETNPSTEAGD